MFHSWFHLCCLLVFVNSELSADDEFSFFHIKSINSDKSVVFAHTNKVYFKSDPFEFVVQINLDEIFRYAPMGLIMNITRLRDRYCDIESGVNDPLLFHRKTLVQNKSDEEKRQLVMLMREIKSYIPSKQFSGFQRFILSEQDMARYADDIVHLDPLLSDNFYEAFDKKYMQLQKETENRYISLSPVYYEFISYVRAMELLREKVASYRNYTKSEKKSGRDFCLDYMDIITQNSILIERYRILLSHINNGLLSAYHNHIHTALIPLKKLVESTKKWEETHKNYSKNLIMPSNKLSFAVLNEIASIQISYEKGFYDISITIPVIQDEAFDLYEIIPYPVPQVIGINGVKVVSWIQPRKKFLLASVYAPLFRLVSYSDFESCIRRGGTFMCSAEEFPMFFYDDERSCEYSLFQQSASSQRNDLTDCDIRVSHHHSPYFYNIQDKGAWIYSLPKNLTVQIHCMLSESDEHAYNRTLQLHGIGILFLTEECVGHIPPSLRILHGYQELLLINEGSADALLISDLVPELNETFITGEMLDLYTADSDERSINVLHCDYTLTDLIAIVRLERLKQRMKLDTKLIAASLSTAIAMGIIFCFYLFLKAYCLCMKSRDYKEWKNMTRYRRECTGERAESPITIENIENISAETNITFRNRLPTPTDDCEGNRQSQTSNEYESINGESSMQNQYQYVPMRAMTQWGWMKLKRNLQSTAYANINQYQMLKFKTMEFPSSLKSRHLQSFHPPKISDVELEETNENKILTTTDQVPDNNPIYQNDEVAKGVKLLPMVPVIPSVPISNHSPEYDVPKKPRLATVISRHQVHKPALPRNMTWTFPSTGPRLSVVYEID